MRNSARSARASADAGGSTGGVVRDMFVIVAMSLVTVAVGLCLHLQLEISGAASILSATIAWGGFILLHLLVRRAQVTAAAPDDIARLSQEIAGLQQANAARVKAAAARDARLSSPLQAGTPAKPPPLPAFAGPSLAQAGNAERTSHGGQGGPQAASRPIQAPAGLGWDLRPGAQREPVETSSRTLSPGPARPGAPIAAASPRDDVREPAPAARPAVAAPLAQAGKTTAVPASEAPLRDEVAKSAELRSMQSLIEQIAKQLTAPADAQAVPEASTTSAGTEQVITQSVEALKAAGGAMRAVASAKPAQGHAAPARPLLPSGLTVAQLTEAIAAERLDTYLDYVFGLDDRKARHFEILIRIRTDDGRSLGTSDCTGMLASGSLHGRLDAARLVRLAKIAERLHNRGTSAALFSTLAPQSLIDDTFLDVCANMLTQQAAIGSQLVLSFAQNDVRTFGKPHWETLATLAENGVRFGIENVADLAMDFDVLKSRGFAFVRADAGSLIAGMQAHDGALSAAQVCGRLIGAGLGLIAGAIHDEAMMAQIAALGVAYGQGGLFGMARPVKIDLKQPREAAA